MNLFQRLLIAPAVALLLMLMLGGIAYLSLRTQQLSLDDLAKRRIGSVTVVADLRASVLRAHAGVYRIFTWTGTKGEAYLEQEGKALLGEFDAAAARFAQWAAAGSLRDDEQAAAKDVTGIITAYRKTA